eukprot:snap_masked-scaffold_5-processed-gene-12.22-mRNA-1 protein AED:1.00 eAED:1.00 QI:0/-1/0/0/-1/1/1/0/144
MEPDNEVVIKNNIAIPPSKKSYGFLGYISHNNLFTRSSTALRFNRNRLESNQNSEGDLDVENPVRGRRAPSNNSTSMLSIPLARIMPGGMKRAETSDRREGAFRVVANKDEVTCTIGWVEILVGFLIIALSTFLVLFLLEIIVI